MSTSIVPFERDLRDRARGRAVLIASENPAAAAWFLTQTIDELRRGDFSARLVAELEEEREELLAKLPTQGD